MLGAIIGDVCGSVYEWRNEKDISKIELFKVGCCPTSNYVMMAAVAAAFMDSAGKDDSTMKETLVNYMHNYGAKFPNAGYGGRFFRWLAYREKEPYNSRDNGSAVRVCAIGWLFDTLEETLHAAKLSAEVTHNHPEGIKGAQAIAAAVFLAQKGQCKEEIKAYIENNFYKLDFTLDQIRPSYTFDVSCQGSCPQAIEAFLEGTSFEDVILKAISIGGDSDKIAAMAGGIAEAYYGIPENIQQEAMRYLTNTYDQNHFLPFPYGILADDVMRFRKHLETEKL